MTLEDVLKELDKLGNWRLLNNLGIESYHCRLICQSPQQLCVAAYADTPLEAATECLNRYKESVK